MLTKRVFRLTDLHCPNCAMRVESIEDTLPGIRQISVSYRKGQMIVEYDESKISDADIITAVKVAGYTAEVEE